MLGLTRLLNQVSSYGDSLRYSKHTRGQRMGTTRYKGPVVAWNITRSCNLKCQHCYSDAKNRDFPDELTTQEAEAVIDDLAAFNVPVILFSGGEPLLRDDLFELIGYARSRGIRITISSNGTLIDREMAARIAQAEISYVGISIDGLETTHDTFRQQKGAFNRALEGIHNCREMDQKVGVRFTINQHNHRELDDVFTLLLQEHIPRACFYHLVYSGRGSTMVEQDISDQKKREAMDLLIDRSIGLQEKGLDKEILTVANHADGVYTYLKLREHCGDVAERILKLLQINGGNRSGIAIANIDPRGDVHPDQFTTTRVLGNVRERPFSEIWKDESGLLGGLRDRKPLLKGRCGECDWVDLCNGNMRVRAEAVHGDFWQEDPACYLTDDEVKNIRQ